MKKSMVAVGMMLAVFLLSFNVAYSQCTANFSERSRVTKYFSGKKTVQKVWDCTVIDNQYGGSVCFRNYPGTASQQRICVSGDFIIEGPPFPLE